MPATVHEFPTGHHMGEAEPTAPALPADGHLVAAAMAAERLRSMANALAGVMEHNPHDFAIFSSVHGEILDAWCAVSDSFNAYHAVRSCEGQA